MLIKSFLFLLIFYFSLSNPLYSQSSDSVLLAKDTVIKDAQLQRRKFVLPASLFVGSFFLSKVKIPDVVVSDFVKNNFPYKTKIDDYLQYSPGLAALTLEMAGVKGKHNLKEKAFILGISSAITIATTHPLKYGFHRLRPDSSARNAFPSGHTATSFAMAEFLRKEYVDVSIWYGVAGYVVAGTTAFLRVYNNRHWLSDIVAGAGVGIFSTRLGYVLYPRLKKMLQKKDKDYSLYYIPYYNQGTAGLSMLVNFH